MLLSTPTAGSACGHGQPVRTTVAAIAGDPDRFVGRCVRLVGFSDGRSLFGSARAMRRHLLMRSMGRSGLRLADQMIGVYDLPGPGDDLADVAIERGLKWSLTGEVDSCGRMQRLAQREADAQPKEEDEIVIVMMAGHCHYLGGPVLRVHEGRVLPRKPRR